MQYKSCLLIITWLVANMNLLFHWTAVCIIINYTIIFAFIAPPFISTSSCQFGGLNPSDNTIGIFLMANVSNGAPSTVTCSLNSLTDTLDSNVFRQVFSSESPTETGVRIVTSVPRSLVPGSVTCTISNSDGSDSFMCNVEGM